MLTAQNLNKRLGRKTIIDNFNFTFQSGIYGLLGPNGAGKTTLMNLLVGALKANGGTVSYLGRDIAKDGSSYRRTLGYLPQEHAMYKNFKAIDFLQYMGRLKAVPPQILNERITSLAQRCGLQSELNKKCGHYSGGMKRRLGLIQALLNEPQVLILDEPSAGLDPVERIKLRNLLASIAGERLIIISTHIVPDVDRLAHQIVFFQNGAIVLQGEPSQLCQQFQGRVIELALPLDYPIHELNRVGYIANLRQEGDVQQIRLVLKEGEQCGKLIENVRQLTALPVLEDVYLALFGTKED